MGPVLNLELEPLSAENFLASLSDDGRYRLLVEEVTDYAISMLDLDGYVTSWNAGARRFKGYEAAEIIGQHFSRFYGDADVKAGLPSIALETARTVGRFEGEGWRVRKDGSRFWANVVIDVIRAPNGEIVGFAEITRDLTERRLAAESLRQSEEQFRLLIYNIVDYAIYMLDLDGRVSNWNAGAERIKGYKSHEIIGRHFSQFYTPEDRAAGDPERSLRLAREQGRFEKEGGWRLRKDGTRFFANVVIDAIHDDKGTLLGYAKITRDITERHNQQIALDQAREALFQFQKLEAIGQLTGGIAHDFNNLLTAVLGSLELLRRRIPADARMLTLLDNAVQGAQRGVGLTQRMLAFARRQELKLQAVQVPSLIRGMADLMQRTLGPSYTVVTKFSADLPLAKADPNQLENAVLNLALNARDAMPGGGEITISTMVPLPDATAAAELPTGRYVKLSVVDKGEGMDAATLAHAVEPFFTTKGVGKGTGLGLSMVKGMVEQLGGKLTMRSAPGIGTTAELWLPVADDTAMTQPPRVRAASAQVSDRPLNILVVEDDHLVLFNTTAMLEEMGHRVLEATSGRQALDIFRREPNIDLVVTDQGMPQMTGAELADAIRTEHARTPILLVTGYAELPPEVATAYPKLSKPFTQKQLADAVDAVVKVGA
jgi:PAS domain S-box-containing protein